MGRTRIGLDIGASAVRAVELSMRSIPPALVRAAQVPMPEGAVANGEIRDSGAVTEAIKDLWRRGRFGNREVVLGVANQRVVVREVTVPWLESREELRASLPFQVQEFVPIPLEDAVLDFHTLEEFEKDGRRMLRLLLVAAQKDMVVQLVTAVEGARLRPIELDLIPFALVRAVGSLDGSSNGEVQVDEEALVDIGTDVTSICIHAAGVPRFVRILPSGGRVVTTAVAKSMGVADAEAERLKRGYATPDEESMLSTASVAANEKAGAFADEIHSSLEFYLTKAPGAHVGQVLLSGGGSQLQGLDQMLAERLPHTTVRYGRAFHRVRADLDLDPDTMAEAEPLLAVAVGLALPGVQA